MGNDPFLSRLYRQRKVSHKIVHVIGIYFCNCLNNAFLFNLNKIFFNEYVNPRRIQK